MLFFKANLQIYQQQLETTLVLTNSKSTRYFWPPLTSTSPGALSRVAISYFIQEFGSRPIPGIWSYFYFVAFFACTIIPLKRDTIRQQLHKGSQILWLRSLNSIHHTFYCASCFTNAFSRIASVCVFCNFAAGTQSRCQSRLLWFKRLRHESELALQHLLRRDSGSRQEWGLWESLTTSSFAESIIKGKPWLACHMGILILQKFKILNLACCQIVNNFFMHLPFA